MWRNTCMPLHHLTVADYLQSEQQPTSSDGLMVMMDPPSSCDSCQCEMDEAQQLVGNSLLQTALVTLMVTCGFMVSKSTYDKLRMRMCKLTTVVLGAGPIGLVSALISCRSEKSSRVVIFEERSRKELVNRPQQIAFDAKSVQFLLGLGVDFDNIEGCWQDDAFFTRIGVFEEYMLSIITLQETPVDVRLRCKFNRDMLKEVESFPGRVLAVVCDGSRGHSASLLGLSDEFLQHSCRAYGAVAAIERPGQRLVPTPETRVHNLTFDINAYDNGCQNDPFPQGFHLKIFGTISHRYMALAVPKCESKLVRTLKMVLDQSVMRHIFQVCFNTYKTEGESHLSDVLTHKYLKFSPRLFELKLSHRLENVAYIEDSDMFVVSEGEAARCFNFHTGMDINLCLKGLKSLEHFIQQAACAETEKDILHVLNSKSAHSRSVTQEFVRNGLRETMFS